MRNNESSRNRSSTRGCYELLWIPVVLSIFGRTRGLGKTRKDSCGLEMVCEGLVFGNLQVRRIILGTLGQVR